MDDDEVQDVKGIRAICFQAGGSFVAQWGQRNAQISHRTNATKKMPAAMYPNFGSGVVGSAHYQPQDGARPHRARSPSPGAPHSTFGKSGHRASHVAGALYRPEPPRKREALSGPAPSGERFLERSSAGRTFLDRQQRAPVAVGGLNPEPRPLLQQLQVTLHVGVDRREADEKESRG